MMLENPYSVTLIATTLNSPSLFSRQLALEILNFLVTEDHSDTALAALEATSVVHRQGSSPYGYWLKCMESRLFEARTENVSRSEKLLLKFYAVSDYASDKLLGDIL